MTFFTSSYNPDVIVFFFLAPMFQIASNAGMSGAVVCETCRNSPFGYGLNAASLKYEDLR